MYFCPRCGNVLIPDRRGEFYAVCRKCGYHIRDKELLNMVINGLEPVRKSKRKVVSYNDDEKETSITKINNDDVYNPEVSKLEEAIIEVINGKQFEKTLILRGIGVLLMSITRKRFDVPSENFPLVIYVKEDRTNGCLEVELESVISKDKQKVYVHQSLRKITVYILREIEELRKIVKVEQKRVTQDKKACNGDSLPFLICPRCGKRIKIDSYASIPRTFKGELKPRFICLGCGYTFQ